MADNLSIARPYAKAVFAQAQTTQQLVLWSKLLEVLAHIAENEQTAALLKNPEVPAEQLNHLFADVALGLVGDLTTEVTTELKNFIALLSLDKRLMVLPDINFLYHQLLIEQEGRVEVQVFYAQALDEETKKRLHARLEKRFNSKVDIEYHQDESLIGGALIKSADWVMDGSVKAKIAKLQDSLL
ncbi:MAG TPA: F0F1 ATP synthase subunit delta [Coxiellaceae bacterium]|nr:F0F1 ATP synthase subunit delta [Coxiellaceae bacterium]